MIARKVRSKNYPKVIEVNVPVRFYWSEDKFDGVEFGPVPSGITKYQRSLILTALRQIGVLMDENEKRKPKL